MLSWVSNHIGNTGRICNRMGMWVMTNEQIAEALNKAKSHFEGRVDINATALINAVVDIIEKKENADNECAGCSE